SLGQGPIAALSPGRHSSEKRGPAQEHTYLVRQLRRCDFPIEEVLQRAIGLDTTAPLHQNYLMRLTVNLDYDLYALAKSLAKSEDCTISAAVNRLMRRSLAGGANHSPRSSRPPVKRNGFIVSHGKRPITADTVGQIEAEDDKT